MCCYNVGLFFQEHGILWFAGWANMGLHYFLPGRVWHGPVCNVYILYTGLTDWRVSHFLFFKNHSVINNSMVNILKFYTPKFLRKCYMQTVQTQNFWLNIICKQCRPRSDCSWRSSLIRVYTVCHSIKYFKKQLHKKQNLCKPPPPPPPPKKKKKKKIICNKIFKILGKLPLYWFIWL